MQATMTLDNFVSGGTAKAEGAKITPKESRETPTLVDQSAVLYVYADGSRSN